MKKITIAEIYKAKGKSKISMLTCYDYSFAKIFDQAGVEVLLVGDSLANVMYGFNDTRQVSTQTMVEHTAAVARATANALVVADMPYASYQQKGSNPLVNAKKFLKAGAKAVKVEWFSYGTDWSSTIKVFKTLINAKIPVMGHIGLTPQTAKELGGYKVQGKDEVSADRLIKQAKVLQDLGVFSLVLECVPQQLAKKITESVSMPTFGIGAGKFCDGQVLVCYDMLGLYNKIRPKFVRQYADLSKTITRAVSRYLVDIKTSHFPAKKESF